MFWRWGGGCTMRMNVALLNCALKNSSDGKFYAVCDLSMKKESRLLMTRGSLPDLPPPESSASWCWAPNTHCLGTGLPSLHLLFSQKGICVARAFSWVGLRSKATSISSLPHLLPVTLHNLTPFLDLYGARFL